MSEAATIRGRSDLCTCRGGFANATTSQMAHVASRCRRRATCVGAMYPKRVFVLTNERPQSAVTNAAANRGAVEFLEGTSKASSSLRFDSASWVQKGSPLLPHQARWAVTHGSCWKIDIQRPQLQTCRFQLEDWRGYVPGRCLPIRQCCCGHTIYYTACLYRS